jgi:hypothetical protein
MCGVGRLVEHDVQTVPPDWATRQVCSHPSSIRWAALRLTGQRLSKPSCDIAKRRRFLDWHFEGCRSRQSELETRRNQVPTMAGACQMWTPRRSWALKTRGACRSPSSAANDCALALWGLHLAVAGSENPRSSAADPKQWRRPRDAMPTTTSAATPQSRRVKPAGRPSGLHRQGLLSGVQY